MIGSGMNFNNNVGATVERRRPLESRLPIRGKFKIQHFGQKDANGNRKLLQEMEVPNGVTDVGINNILDVYFDAGTQITTWYLGLIDNSGYSAVAAADTMASHAGWTEFTGYSEANRVTWNPDPASAKTISNSTTVDFNISSAGTLRGAFAVSDNTKGGTTGVLWATALFTSTIPVTGGDLIKLTYTVQGA